MDRKREVIAVREGAAVRILMRPNFKGFLFAIRIELQNPNPALI